MIEQLQQMVAECSTPAKNNVDLDTIDFSALGGMVYQWLQDK